MTVDWVTTATLNSWDEIHKYAQVRRWIWRGHECRDWEIKSSIERLFERRAIHPSRRSYVEGELLRQFTRTYHQWAHHVPETDAGLEWYSIMQHHGAPTRLVDFSYSIYVAAYFATEEAREDCALWGFDSFWLAESCAKAFRDTDKSYPHKFMANTSREQEIDARRALFDPPFAKCVLPINPFQLSERSRIQKSVFAVPGDITYGFMDNLLALPKEGLIDHSIRLVIPRSMIATAVESLFYMNVSRTGLFPGLDGYSRSLAVYHPSFNKDGQFHEE